MKRAMILCALLGVHASAFAQALEPEAENPHTAPQRKPLSEERPDHSVPPGSIRVHVLDETDTPVPNADIVLGILKSSGERESKPARTGGDGTYVFSGLTFGDMQAYRVNVPFQGAKYGSSPFRLEAANGYDVIVRRLPVTRDERMIVLYVGATSVELKDDRLKIVQQSRLLNLGNQTYVFPDKGALVKFPAGFTAVVTEDAMGDQHVAESKGEGVRVKGSLPPGETTLIWGFDLTLEGSEASFDVGLPWITFAYRVISDAPPGLSLSVKEMPDPFLQRDQGRSFFITEMQRRVGDPPFRVVSIHLAGIPGPGPERFIALGLAIGIVLSGAWVARRKTAGTSGPAEKLPPIRVAAETLARARQLDAECEAGTIGPEYHREQRDALVDELALQLLARADVGEQRPAKTSGR